MAIILTVLWILLSLISAAIIAIGVEDISCIAEEVRNKDWFEAFNGKTYSIEEETVF